MGMLISLLQGVGLSTASGLNAFVPLLVVGLLGRTGLIHLNSPWDFVTHPVALILLALLGFADFIADKIPGVDHVMHGFGLVLHPVVGAVLFLMASDAAGTVHPVLAAVVGLVLAGGTHVGRMAVRPISTVTTGGLANPLVSLIEDSVALLMSVLVVVVPVCGALLLLLIIVFALLLIQSRRPAGPSQP